MFFYLTSFSHMMILRFVSIMQIHNTSLFLMLSNLQMNISHPYCRGDILASCQLCDSLSLEDVYENQDNSHTSSSTRLHDVNIYHSPRHIQHEVSP